MEYSVLAYYVIREVHDPQSEVKAHRNFLSSLDSRGRIYIGTEGINAQLSVATKDLDKYLNYIKEHPVFYDADVKIHSSDQHAFAKLKVKYRKQLVAIDRKVDFNQRGEYLNSDEWAEKLENRDENTIVIDTRNSYETKVGHFEGSMLPDLQTFRQFPEYAEDLAKKYDNEKTKVMMFCTGGIRCEYYSALMKEIGFKNVYHLKGGVIKYGIEKGRKHWKGKLFVFDDRMNVPICDGNHEVIAQCHFCGKPNDTFYNCANMDCNDLFTSCPECVASHKGCCSTDCLENGRVRAFEPSDHPKPFRKLSQEEKISLKK